MTDQHTWKYHAETRNGENVHGKLIATSQLHAIAQLRDQHLLPIDLTPISQSLFARFFTRSVKLNAKELTNLVKAMSDLLEAGIPLSDMLTLLEERENAGAPKSFLQRIKLEVRNGAKLSDAFRKDPANLPRLMIAMVEAGEATGTLDKQLTRFAETQERSYALRRDLIGQLLYPLVLCGLVILTIFFLSYFVLPEFETIFSDGETRVPPETKLILEVGAWIRNWGGTLPLILAGILLAGQFMWRRYRALLESIALQLPIIKSFFFTLEGGRFCRALGVMLQGGMAIVPALEVAQKAVGFGVFRDRFSRASQEVRAGAPLSKSLHAVNALHQDNIRFIELGERTGEMGSMVSKAASANEVSIKTSLKRFTDLLSPVLTIFMGLITAGVIGSVMSGVLSLNETVY